VTTDPYEELEREFDRIAGDADLRGGFATTDPRVTMELILAALRATPTGAGTVGFERTLKTMLDALGDPPSPSASMPASDSDALRALHSQYTQDDRVRALLAEFKRVVPRAWQMKEQIVFEVPKNLVQALAAVRSLPDGAGLEAWLRAMGYSERIIRGLLEDFDAGLEP
jgi:hypothetical protein